MNIYLFVLALNSGPSRRPSTRPDRLKSRHGDMGPCLHMPPGSEPRLAQPASSAIGLVSGHLSLPVVCSIVYLSSDD